MNIFILSLNVLECAMFHCDQHVIKMILESAQLLCTVVLMSGGKAGYRIVLPKHKCTLWALASLANWKWLRDLAFALNDEFKFRYNRTEDHQSISIIRELDEPNILDIGITEFHQAMPEQFKDLDPVVAYRKYYAGAKFEFATWKKRDIPGWYVSLREQLGGDALTEAKMLADPIFLKEKRRKAKEEKMLKKIKKEEDEKKKMEKKSRNKGKGKSKEWKRAGKGKTDENSGQIKNDDKLSNDSCLKIHDILKSDNDFSNIDSTSKTEENHQNHSRVKTRRMIRQSSNQIKN